MKLPKEYKSAGGMIEAQVIKIYSAKSPSGAEYCSYVIKWNNSEVVVANMFSSDKESKDIKVDDTIQVMAHEIEMSISGEKMHILQFMFLGAVDDKGAEEK
mgnify:FL=1